MELFKNKVGRPSNETIRKRRTIYVLIFVAVIGIIGTGVFYVSNIFNNNAINSKGKNVATNTIAKSGDVASEIKLGGDGKITIEDVEIIHRLVAGEKINGKTKDTLYKTGTKNKLADINGDGKVDDKDTILASMSVLNLQYIIKNSIKDVNIGSIDKNGTLDEEDLSLIEQYLQKKATLTESQIKLADVNKDGKVDMSDFEYLSKFVVNLNGYKLGDINNDGKLNTEDVTLLEKITTNKLTTTSLQKKAADINADGKINTDDKKILDSIVRTGKSYIIGDVNKDGERNSKDLTLLNNYINKKKTFDALQLDLADVNRDGKVDNIDKTILERILSGYGDVVNAYNSKGDGKLTWEDYELIQSNIGNSVNLSSNKFIDAVAGLLNSSSGKLSNNQKKAADINGDGKITEEDAEEMLNIKDNKFKPYTGVSNKTTIKYDEKTQILTLNGSFEKESIALQDFNTTFKAGEQYRVKLEYVDGSVEIPKNCLSAFEVEVKKKNRGNLSTKNGVAVEFPTSVNKTAIKTLTISKIGANEGKELFVWLTHYKNKDLKFKNYKIKVSIVNTSILTAVFYPNGSGGERKIATCNTLGGSSCTLYKSKGEIPEIEPKSGFNVEGWSTNKNSTTAQLYSVTNEKIKGGKITYQESPSTISLSKNAIYYAITKNPSERGIYFYSDKENIYYDKNQKKDYIEQFCNLYNGASSCTVKAPYINAQKGETVLGWTKQEGSSIIDAKVNDTIVIDKLSTYYYPVIRKKITATFDKNTADSLSFSKSTCFSYDNGCTVAVPTIKPKDDFKVVGFGTSKTATTSELNSNYSKITSDIKYNAITRRYKKTITITFNKNTAASLSFYKATCVSYEDQGCKINKIPVIYSKGNEIKGFVDSKGKNGEIGSVLNRTFYNDTTLYASIDNDDRNYKSQYDIYREETILGKPIYFEGIKDGNNNLIKGSSVMDNDATAYYNYLAQVADSKRMPYMFITKSPINFVTETTIANSHKAGILGVTYNTGVPFEYPNSDINAKGSFNESSAASAIHELGHTVDMYYAVKKGKWLCEQPDIQALYNKYKDMDKNIRPMRDYSYTDEQEFLGDMFEYYYYYKFRTMVANPKGGNPLNNEMAKVLEKYINELKQWM